MNPPLALTASSALRPDGGDHTAGNGANANGSGVLARLAAAIGNAKWHEPRLWSPKKGNHHQLDGFSWGHSMSHSHRKLEAIVKIDQ